jgi:hypothetical protein
MIHEKDCLYKDGTKRDMGCSCSTSPSELKKAEELATKILCSAWGTDQTHFDSENQWFVEIQEWLVQALRRQTRDVLDSPEVQALAGECEVHGEGGRCEDCLTALSNFQRFREEMGK